MDQHLEMLRQLRHSYADNETELDNARRITALHEEIAQLCHDDEQEVRTVIRGATARPGSPPRKITCQRAGAAPCGTAPLYI